MATPRAVELKDKDSQQTADVKPDGTTPVTLPVGVMLEGWDETGQAARAFRMLFSDVWRVAVDAYISGGVIPPVGTVVGAHAAQNLGAAPLSLTTAVAAKWDPRFVSLAFSVPLVGNETLKVTLKSAFGAAYDVVIEELTLKPADTAEHQGYFYAFPPDMTFNVADEIEVTLTNTGAVEAAVVSCVIRGEG